MIETLISSKTRIKLLLKFFLNSSTTAYLRSLEQEFGESTNAIRLELNRLEQAGMLTSQLQGNKKIFQANVQHPLFGEVHNIIMKHIGLDRIIETVIDGLGKVNKIYLAGKFSQGLNSEIIDLILVGDIDKIYLIRLIEKAESLVKRKIRYLIYTDKEYAKVKFSAGELKPLLIWSKD
ncbi:MAG: ArsR family transcriptional regulator [Saprospiraceae bacterium]|nr:ArsR family transcriptional regulator [Saprospiraceae bacterium]